MKRCINPECGAELEDNAKFCMECGTKQPQEYVCPACGAKFDQPSKFCMACGAKMDGTGGAPKIGGLSIGDNNAISAKDIIGGDKIEAQNYVVNNVMGPQKSEAELKMDNLSMKKMSKEFIREEMAKAKDFEKQGDYYHAVAIYKELDAEDNNDAACAILFLDYKKLFVVDNEERDTLLNKIRKAADEGHSEALFLIGVYTINSNKNMAFQYIERAAMNRFPTAIDYLDKYYGYNDDGTRKDVTEEAFRWFEKSAQMDSIQGQFLYADCYLNGYIVEKDPRKAAQVFRPLAEKGNPEFQYKMGKAMEDFGDDDEYEKWIKKSAEQGFMEAQLELANYYDQCGVDEMAHEWYKKAAEQGCAEAQYCYAIGLEDERVQLIWYEKAALRDYAPAQSALGDCYYNGWGTFKDYKMAVQWYRKSAEQGNNRGQKGLGKCYYYGNGVECDYKEAIKWCTEATKGRYANEEAYYILGDCYFYGEGVEQNYEKAVELYEKAKDFPKAIYSLGFCYTEGLLGEENFKEGFKLFKKAAEKGYDQAQYRLARCYSDSLEIFVKKDDKEAFKWYKKAAEQGHVFSMFKMFACYSSGIGVTKDENEAAKWAAYFKRTGADPLDGITYDHYKDWHDFERSKKNKTTQPKTNVTTPKPQPQPAPQPTQQPKPQPVPQPAPQPAAPAKTETSSGTVQVVLINAGVQKLAVVKAVKEYLNLGLKESMDLVSDHLPNTIATLDEAQAQEFYNILTDLGANVEIRTGGSGKAIAPAQPESQPQAQPKSQPQANDANIFNINGVKLEMVTVESGTFTMGENQNGLLKGDEHPAHQVALSEYHIGKYPVTVAQFRQFVEATGYTTQAELKGRSMTMEYVEGRYKPIHKDGLNWKYGGDEKPRGASDDNHPVIHISWIDANAFCKWLAKVTGKNFRLPTEAEWEFAAKGGVKSKGFRYSGSDNYDEVAVYKSKNTAPVGTKKPNELGIYDMSGNVAEWCNDWHGKYSRESQVNPQGPSTGLYRVSRSASWFDEYRSDTVRRSGFNVTMTGSKYGFRVAYSDDGVKVPPMPAALDDNPTIGGKSILDIDDVKNTVKGIFGKLFK